jgi:hypothetical protein
MPQEGLVPTRREVLAGAAALAVTAGGVGAGTAAGDDRAGEGVRCGQSEPFGDR